MEKQFVWLNDELIPISQARVPVNDRGFLYGDGLFETLRADAGHVHFLTEHLERLAASARAFRLPFSGQHSLAGAPGAIAGGQRSGPGSGPGENSPHPGGGGRVGPAGRVPSHPGHLCPAVHASQS